MKQISQIVVSLLDHCIVEGDVSTVVLHEQQRQQSRSLILPGGLVRWGTERDRERQITV